MPREYSLDRKPPNVQRRPGLAMEDEWIVGFLQRAQIGYVATRWDEQPFITPTTFWYDGERQEIYFHSNITGRIRANAERHAEVCFAASLSGNLLPSNIALEFSIQYESVLVFGRVRVIEDEAEKERILYGLLAKYFSDYKAEKEFRPITAGELKRTSVYGITIDSWSGKRNWPAQAEQSPDWPALPGLE